MKEYFLSSIFLKKVIDITLNSFMRLQDLKDGETIEVLIFLFLINQCILRHWYGIKLGTK
jgi:hypothetical protein